MDPNDLLRIFFFNSGGSYRVPAAPAVPTEDSPEMKQAAAEAAAKEKERLRKAKGRQSTILTGGQGVTVTPALKSGYLTGLRETLGE